MNGHIVVVGSLNMDLVVHAPRHPKIGETLLGTDFCTCPGGKGANQAVAAARLGGSVKMVGRVGSDGFGDVLLNTLVLDGVDCTYVRRDIHESTGVALITVDSNGQNTIVVAPGANGQVTPEDISTSEQAFIGASVLLVQLECPMAAVQRAVEIGKSHEVCVILNPAPAQPLNAELLSKVDYLIPNQAELLLLTSLNRHDVAITCLHELGVPVVVVTLGADGVLVSENGTETHIPALPTHVIDTTAAGDAFIGAFALAITRGCSNLESATWGNLAASVAVSRSGAQPSLPTWQELEAELKPYREGLIQGNIRGKP
jgi:ribokinase